MEDKAVKMQPVNEVTVVSYNYSYNYIYNYSYNYIVTLSHNLFSCL